MAQASSPSSAEPRGAEWSSMEEAGRMERTADSPPVRQMRHISMNTDTGDSRVSRLKHSMNEGSLMGQRGRLRVFH